MEIKILGQEDVVKRLNAMREMMGGPCVAVGTNVKYAVGIEYGRKRNGRLARRAGGTFALTDAFNEVKPTINDKIKWELLMVSAGHSNGKKLVAVMKGLAMEVKSKTSELLNARIHAVAIPLNEKGKPKWRRTGQLRRSYHVEVLRGGQ